MGFYVNYYTLCNTIYMGYFMKVSFIGGGSLSTAAQYSYNIFNTKYNHKFGNKPAFTFYDTVSIPGKTEQFKQENTGNSFINKVLFYSCPQRTRHLQLHDNFIHEVYLNQHVDVI